MASEEADNDFDVIVIGAGMGGLIAACQLARAGKRVIVVENLSFIGGRFSAFQSGGVEIPSGAFHTFPHGHKGPMAQALKRSGANVQINTSKMFASFHVRGKHIVCTNGFGVFNVVPRLSDKVMLARILLQSWVTLRYDGSFGDWLRTLHVSDDVMLLYERFAGFALSASVHDVPYAEGRKVIEMIIRYGLPGIPMGGAREVARQMGLAASRAGVIIRKNTQARRLLTEEDKLCGVVVHDRRRDVEYTIHVPVVVSNAGPLNTLELAREAGFVNGTAPEPPIPAIGLKIHVLSPRSLIDHDAIMFCLDTQRIAGILQATNVDADLAPKGWHLLVSHQVMPPGADWQAERDLGLADWKYLFGSAFDDCQVVGVSHFPARFPVNWAAQGHDTRTQPFARHGLWMVGDGMKPPGLMMVEGVAAGAELTVQQILRKRS
jgi:phytoene dehydrogenase-like protein